MSTVRRKTSIDIVIPAYKARYLRPLLDSLVAQTSQDFGVIVADDASPEALLPICENYSHLLAIGYHRFEQNLGSTDLAGHWNRAVALSNADWVMLPGDDDEYDANCFAALRALLETGDYDVVSFAVRTIDEQSQASQEVTTAAAAEGSFDFLLNLRSVHSPVTVGYAFSRQVFEKYGGFVSFDSGWHSDTATWALFSSRTGITPVPNAAVSWRKSSSNITPAMKSDPTKYLRGEWAFLVWLGENPGNLRITSRESMTLIEKFAWGIYPLAAELRLSAFIPAAWSMAFVLRRLGSLSVARHLLRFARQRWFNRALQS